MVEYSEIAEAMIPLLKEFSDGVPNKLLEGLPHLRNIHIIFVWSLGHNFLACHMIELARESMRSCDGMLRN